MKCQVCGEAEASIHFKDLRGEEVQEMHLCASCAVEKGFHTLVEQQKAAFQQNLLWMAEGVYPEGVGKMASLQCDHCGLRYSEFTQIGRLGCPECYDSFAVQLRRLMRRIHGATRHTGKGPGQPVAPSGREERLRRLQDDLRRAIASERYEDAARIRDEIRQTEGATAEGSPS